MDTYKPLFYKDIAALARPIATESEEFTHYKSEHDEWGCMEARQLHADIGAIIEYKADLTGDFRIRYEEEQMLHAINICFNLHGGIGLHLSQSDFSTRLDSQQHHSIYAPEPDYELLVRKNIHGFHLAIDREYYAGLLCEHDPRTAHIKEKLMNRERIWQGVGIVDAGMKQALLEIFNNPMSGKLRSLLIEAKVLELVVLQLDQLSTHRATVAVKRADADVFYEIRQFLQQHYREQLSLRGISRTFGVNEFKLKKGFKELFKTTIFEYVHDLKMVHARELLLDGKMYVNEVSHHIGYKNANHFSTAFKRKFGTSPSGLR